MKYEVKNEEFESKSAYFILVADDRVSEMTYSKAGTDRIIIDHTEVNEAYRAKGLGEMMVRRAVEDARKGKIAIVPLCPFAQAVFQRHPELRDVL